MEWRSRWYPIAGDSAQVEAMEHELRRELADGHPLFGLPVRAVSRRQDCDDVLFAIEDGSGRVAVVHLTWTRRPPDRPPWPVTNMYPSHEAWTIAEMQPWPSLDRRGVGG